MATRTITSLVDDIDGGEADSTIAFSVEGVDYVIDLSSANAQAFQDALEPYRSAARRTKTSPARRRSGRGNKDYDPALVREWAKGQGIELGERGRIPASVINSYRAGH